MPNPKKEPDKELEKKPEKAPEEESEKTPEKAPEGNGFDPMALSDTMAAIMAEVTSLKQAVSALANEGGVNAAVAEDNGEEYPEIDLDEVNRLIGV